VVVVLVTMYGALTLRSYYRTQDWKDALTLYTADEPRSRDAFDLQLNLASEFVNADRLDDALVHAFRALELAPESSAVTHDIGAIYYLQGDRKKAEEYFILSVEQEGKYRSHASYITLLLEDNRIEEAEAFIRTRSLPLFPYNQELNVVYQQLLQASGEAILENLQQEGQGSGGFPGQAVPLKEDGVTPGPPPVQNFSP
jgi:hypothetical protein